MTGAMVPSSGSYYGYRGEIFPLVTFAKEWVGLPLVGDAERFPDAIEVHAGPGEAWVKIPRSALDGAYRRRVQGRWNGVLIDVGSVVRGGPDRGRVSVSYAGADPAEAIAAGLMGDQYNGWSAAVDAAEIEVVSDEMVARPVVER
ncbi:hypothetical protein [Pseudolysinimonas sp.]|jgi:hypothetical protein|uniref:hypothetical protein n=1 Tax=Pseudolysinimonas sp. TaxID=2680009 RepID=UPI003784D50F